MAAEKKRNKSNAAKVFTKIVELLLSSIIAAKLQCEGPGFGSRFKFLDLR